MTAKLPSNELQRLELLHDYHILDTPAEQEFDDITALAAQICCTPIALISLVAEDRQWMKSTAGSGIVETPREQSFCAHALQQTDVMVVPDATRDSRFRDNPLVTGEASVRFYAGAPLVAPGGLVLGTLCVIDHQERPGLSEQQSQALMLLAREVMTHLELRRKVRELRISETRYRQLFEQHPQPVWAYNLESRRFLAVNDAAVAHYGYSHEEFLGMKIDGICLGELEASGIWRHQTKDGRVILAEITSDSVDIDGCKASLSLVIDVTRRVAVEQALRNSEILQRKSAEAQKAILNALPAHIALLDGQGNIVAVNESWLRFQSANGFQGEQFCIGLNYLDACGGATEECPEDAHLVAAGLSQVLSGDAPSFSYEYPCHGPDQDRWFRLVACPLNESGNEGVVVMHVNTTERKLAEIALERSNRALQMRGRCNAALIRSRSEYDLLESICQIAFEVGGFRLAWVGYALDDEEKTIEPQACAGVNETHLSRIRITWSEDDQGPEGTVIRSGEPLVIPDLEANGGDRPWLESALANGFRGLVALPLKDQTRTFGVLMLYLPEVRVMLTDELSLLQDLGDDLAFGIINLRALVERRIGRRQISQQAALLDKARDAILVLDLDHCIRYWNRSAERLYGWTAQEVMGRAIDDFLYPASPVFLAATEATLAHGEWTGEIEQTCKDGNSIVAEARWTLVCDEEGQPQSFLSINTDITDRKKLEQQFLRAQRLESIGTLAGGIAHDLNNVLAPIMMSIDLLRTHVNHPNGLQILEMIGQSAHRGAQMVGQVLTFAQGMEGKTEEVQFAHVLRDLRRIVDDTFPKNIRIVTIAEPDLWFVKGDATQIHQVLLNLCVNSRDAMPEGGQITIRAENIVIDDHYAGMNIDASPGLYLKIEVEDTGPGIARETLDKLFDPFFTTKDIGQGPGLGLSTSLAIIKGHGGFIRPYSDLGMGSCFRVYLPAIADSHAAPIAPATVSLPRGNGETILVVDDEASIRQVTRQTLEAFGYKVLLASDGSEAVSVYVKHQAEISVVLTDMMMPIMDGPATIQVLRRLNPNVRVIGASGISSNGKVAKAVSGGLTHFLPKPYSAETLLRAIKNSLSE